MKKPPELLIPAGSLEVLKTAVIFGADAVYIGGEVFGLRARARNFSKKDMIEGIAFAHERGVKVYVTANILAHNGDLKEAEAYFEELREVKPDAFIISDPGMFLLAKKYALKWKFIFPRRRTIPIISRTASGGSRGQNGW